MSGVCSECRSAQQVILSLLLSDSPNTNQDSLTFFKHSENAQLLLFCCSSCLFKSCRLPTHTKKNPKTNTFYPIKTQRTVSTVPAVESRENVDKLNLKDILQCLL